MFTAHLAPADDDLVRRARLHRLFADTASAAAGGGATVVQLRVAQSEDAADATLRRADGALVEVAMDKVLGTAVIRPGALVSRAA
jgi:hypothetical protein